MSVIETKIPTIELPKAPEQAPEVTRLEAYVGATAVEPIIEADPNDVVTRALVDRFIANQEAARVATEEAAAPNPAQTKPFSELRGARMQQLNRR